MSYRTANSFAALAAVFAVLSCTPPSANGATMVCNGTTYAQGEADAGQRLVLVGKKWVDCGLSFDNCCPAVEKYLSDLEQPTVREEKEHGHP